MSILEDSDKLRRAIIDGLGNTISKELEAEIWELIGDFMYRFDRDGENFLKGKPSVKLLLSIEKDIQTILEKAGYFDAANTFIADLGKITRNTIELHESINDIDFKTRRGKIVANSLTAIEQVHTQKVVEILNEGGLSDNFVIPVRNAIHQAVTFGNSIQATRDYLKEYITGDGDEKTGRLSSYLTVTARDTVAGMQGEQMQSVQEYYKMPYIMYVGPIIKNSAAQCVQWHEQRYIEVDKLDEEIAQVRKKQAAKASIGKHKYSGFRPTTTAKTFCIDRGHHGCMHQAIPVRVKR